ncbi:MAG: bifunctional folylpolyglutamate synthase/dihydrofolate synthase [Bacteroides sp.]|nr:bifunctional folylpolyglutamate synthase/dihydrofolate synthase [Roseburia sp.]MCM1345614.1 bifunctional folylpolyglutamate synthase/dihydrofolate synthase [Bacteroides sp.]MCM1420751.1 bifunctional folylpolyglutamate synthase/dihydrofolate synthase [Bacteroides sp.]
MTYKETTEYLFNSTPLFQNIGKDAYKAGLETTCVLDEHFGHPHRRYKTVHVAGTNGKGSCSHTLAAILQSAGYKVGLFTSPHLVDFRERIRINGEMIPEQAVVDFVEKERYFFEPLHPSFFELTTALAFKYFADEKVDVAVIEVGLGGRLDCTNIITPMVSVITNISFDHVQFLGNTLAEIAGEKAGIIKEGIPVVVGNYTVDTRGVFLNKAQEMNAPLRFACEKKEIVCSRSNGDGTVDCLTHSYGAIRPQLTGFCQEENANTILTTVKVLSEQGFNISERDVCKGFANVCDMTGLMGRWQQVADRPLTICDTGHNVGGFLYTSLQIDAQICRTKRIVIGMVSDKDISGVLRLLPKDAVYYFCQASVRRALEHTELKKMAEKYHLYGDSYPTVWEAYQAARDKSSSDDFVFVGGSSFVVADLLSCMQQKRV